MTLTLSAAALTLTLTAADLTGDSGFECPVECSSPFFGCSCVQGRRSDRVSREEGCKGCCAL